MLNLLLFYLERIWLTLINGVTVVSGPPDTSLATRVDFVYTSAGLTTGGVDSAFTYTVPVNKKLVLDFIKISSQINFKSEILIDAVSSDIGFGMGNGAPALYLRKYVFLAGTVFTANLTNKGSNTTPASIYVNMSGDLYDA